MKDRTKNALLILAIPVAIVIGGVAGQVVWSLNQIGSASQTIAVYNQSNSTIASVTILDGQGQYARIDAIDPLSMRQTRAILRSGARWECIVECNGSLGSFNLGTITGAGVRDVELDVQDCEVIAVRYQ